MDNYYIKYLEIKSKYLKLKKQIEESSNPNNKSTIKQNGGMGYTLTITNGYDSFRVSSFTQLVKLKKILKKKEGKDFLIVTKRIDSYLEEESYPDDFISTIPVNDKTYNEILDVAKYLKIITY